MFELWKSAPFMDFKIKKVDRDIRENNWKFTNSCEIDLSYGMASNLHWTICVNTFPSDYKLKFMPPSSS